MAYTSVQFSALIEKEIRSHLTSLRGQAKGATTFELYTHLQSKFPTENLTAGFVNKILNDMRTTGIVVIGRCFLDPRTVRTSDNLPPNPMEWVLSDAAWEFHKKSGTAESGVSR